MATGSTCTCEHGARELCLKQRKCSGEDVSKTADERNVVCALAGHGPCGGKTNGEHYVSQAVLRRLAPSEGITISGTPWTAAGPKTVGKAALTANIVCENHNSGLSGLDSIGGRWMASIQEAQLALASTSPRSQTHTFDGLKLERFFLKLAFMLWRSGNFASAGEALKGVPPGIWADLLTAATTFPPTWVLYVPISNAPFMTVDRQFSAMPLTGSDGSGIKAINFEMANVPFYLVLGNPDNQTQWGIRRPRQLDIGNDRDCHRLRLSWPEGQVGESVTMRRIGDPPTN